MIFTALHGIGWRARASRQVDTCLHAPWRRILRCVLAACLVAALTVTAVADLSAMSSLAKGLAVVHSLFGAGTMSILVYGGLSIFAAVANGILAAGEVLSALVVGGAMMGALPFAQPSDTSTAKSATDPAVGAARAEMQVGLYGGKSESPDSDVTLKSPDGTDLVLKDIEWKPESIKPAPYYGGRGIDWNTYAPALGVMVDFTHAKATAIRGQTVSLSGTHKGEDAPETAEFESIFRKLEFTHGLNFLTLNGVYRATGLHRRIVPYAGLGFGFTIPHVLAWRTGQDKKDIINGPQVTGFAAQVFGGIEWRVFKSDRRSVFTEYKLTYTTNDVTLKDGGSVLANIWVHQFILGGYYTPWRASDAAAK